MLNIEVYKMFQGQPRAVYVSGRRMHCVYSVLVHFQFIYMITLSHYLHKTTWHLRPNILSYSISSNKSTLRFCAINHNWSFGVFSRGLCPSKKLLLTEISIKNATKPYYQSFEARCRLTVSWKTKHPHMHMETTSEYEQSLYYLDI